MLNRLPILLAQIQAGNNSKSLNKYSTTKINKHTPSGIQYSHIAHSMNQKINLIIIEEMIV